MGVRPGAGWTPGPDGEQTATPPPAGKRAIRRPRRGWLVVAALAVALCAPLRALADDGDQGSSSTPAVVPASLLQQAQANPAATFDVIVQGQGNVATTKVDRAVRSASGQGSVTDDFKIINGVAATLTGAQVQQLAQANGIASIVPDVPVAKADVSLDQIWPQVVHVGELAGVSAKAPAIAVVDSGVDATLPDLAGRVAAQVNLYTGTGANSPGDGRGHGTMVAAIAAGAAAGHQGAAPGAKIVSLDVLGDDGSGTESDAIAAADWILQNKARYNIRVANFSLDAASRTSFLRDPLDRAVEKLWLAGVTVVAAAGNYGTGSTPSGVVTAPANDPFVITVGAADTNGTVDPSDDVNAPWSAFGRTVEGFAKPELGAPGRALVVPIATGSTMIGEHPEREVAPGYMWISGTSFAAPVVAGAAADVLALHPTWTPDQVKGALMMSAHSYSPAAPRGSLGVGVVDALAAARVPVPPNPNAALERFLSFDPNKLPTPIFNAVSWAEVARGNVSWAEVARAAVSWAEAARAAAASGAVSWAEAARAAVSWAEVSWAEVSWAEVSWAESAGEDVSWAEGTNANASWFQ